MTLADLKEFISKQIAPGAVEARRRGLVPRTGDWQYPGRWVRPSQQTQEGEAEKQSEQEDFVVELTKNQELVNRANAIINSIPQEHLKGFKGLVIYDSNNWKDLKPYAYGEYDNGKKVKLEDFSQGVETAQALPNGYILINPKYFESLPLKFTGMNPEKFFVPEDFEKYIISHEIGHIVNYNLDPALREQVENTFESPRKRGPFLSDYSKEDSLEWFAELYSIYMDEDRKEWLANRNKKAFDFIENTIKQINSSSVELEKAVVSTPMKEGKVDLSPVKTGDSVWITVTDPESPLHGRPILITRRPDGLFALTGGAGAATEARRHVVLTGTPRKTRRDEELEDEIEKVHDYNDPIMAAKKELESEAKREIKEASGQMMEALGIRKPDKKQFLDKKDEIQNYIEDILGEDEKEKAKRMTDTMMRHIVATERKVAERIQRDRQFIVAKVGKRLSQLREEASEEMLAEVQNQLRDYDSFTVNMPNVEDIKDLSPNEQESVLANYLDKQAELFFEEDRNDHVAGEKEEIPQIEIGTNVKPLELRSPEDLRGAVDSIKNYWNKRKEAEHQGELLKRVPLAQATPSTLNSLRESIQDAGIDVDLDEVERRAGENYDKWMRDSSALALYDTVGKFWNEDTSLTDRIHDKDTRDTVMKFHIDSGAATAITALAKEHLGVRVDTKRLIENGNVELAAAALAYEIRTKEGQTTQDYESVIDSVRAFNTDNQVATERKTLERHENLDKQYQEIQRQKQTGELLDQVRISSLELDNLIEQRKNLGGALGSLQASATFFDYLERFRTAKNDVVNINVGNNLKDAESVVDKLKLSRGYNIDDSDPDNISVKVGLSSLGRMITQERDISAKNDKYEAIKTDTSGVSEDERGNLVVDNYDVPFWKKEYEDEAGETQEYKWRVEQRNDINWLLETTKPTEDNPLGHGGGLITRVVGAGKTNTSLGFFANKLQANPNYKALIAVPRGRSQQWVDEARKFTDLPIEHIPDGMAKSQVDDILLASKPGTIFVTGHREASRSHDVLTALQSDPELQGKFDGITIDEPQEMISRGQSGNIGALGKRLMKLPFDHRLGLTATPARRNPLEAYDMVKWTSGTRDLGSKASFNRSFSGFGSGTNAQDTAINSAYFSTIQPFISGSRITHPTFKTNYDDVGVRRTPGQIRQQRKIERDSQAYIDRRRQEITDEVRRNPNHSLRRSANWEANLSRNATKMARKEIDEQHRHNMDGGAWEGNSKLLALKDSLERGSGKKHVIYIDSRTQRNALTSMLSDMGYSSNKIKNIAATTTSITGAEMAARVKAFKEGNIDIMLIDEKSASGYNLQQGDQMHFIGDPQTGASYLQAQGRIARMPRKGDVDIKTYKYEDDVSEQAHWNDLDSQLKVLRAAAPAMFPE